MEDGTLSLVYCQAGQVQLGDLEKDLTVLLPRDLTLEELEVDTGAAPVQVSDIAAGAMTLGTGSGAIDLQACQVTEGARLDTGSGNITADLTGSPGDPVGGHGLWGGVTHGRAGVPVYGGHRFRCRLRYRGDHRDHGGRHGVRRGHPPGRPAGDLYCGGGLPAT